PAPTSPPSPTRPPSPGRSRDWSAPATSFSPWARATARTAVRSSWPATRSDGTSQRIGPGQTVPLRSGLELELADGARAVVRAR
ncbi:hypothetical protein R6G00_20690, partial [Streptomyces roseofulvus]|nr:hypothetical protein [Streptomyces roseolus]